MIHNTEEKKKEVQEAYVSFATSFMLELSLKKDGVFRFPCGVR